MSIETEASPVAAPMGKKPTIKTVREVRGITRPEVDPALKRRQPIAAGKVRLAQYQRNMWAAVVPDDMTAEDLEDPAVWIHSSREWLMHDRVEIIQSRRWTEAIVVDVGAGSATVKVLQSIEVPERQFGREKALPPGYLIRQGAPDESPYVVVREQDGWVMNRSERHLSFEDARRWLLDLAIFR
jgi:hypothetical protein